MTIYFCKMCGRSARYDDPPNFCYFDRSDSLENVSDEDAEKMGIDIPEGETFEFPGDIRWDPVTGDKLGGESSGRRLEGFQRKVMEGVEVSK